MRKKTVVLVGVFVVAFTFAVIGGVSAQLGGLGGKVKDATKGGVQEQTGDKTSTSRGASGYEACKSWRKDQVQADNACRGCKNMQELFRNKFGAPVEDNSNPDRHQAQYNFDSNTWTWLSCSPVNSTDTNDCSIRCGHKG